MSQLVENAYSYARLSSKKQLKGAGADRQMLKPEQICKEEGWILSPKSFNDLGVSAFSGRNRLKGSLGEFIKLAETGKLLPNPVLIIEAFDRFSRQDIDESEGAIIDLLKSGVAIHVGFSRKTFTKDSTKSLADRIEILVAMKQAFDYSNNLSKRVRDAKQRKIDKIKAGGTANVNEMSPYFFTYSGNQFVTNDKSDIVVEIFKQYINGETICGIASYFNERNIPAFQGGTWQRASIRLILSSESVTGKFHGKLIYPTIVSQSDYDKVQVMLERNKGRRGARADLVNIFRGLVFCKCGLGVQLSKNKGRNYSYYRCPGNRLGTCQNVRGFRTDLLEEDFFGIVLKRNPEELLKSESGDMKKELQELNIQKEVISKKINTLLNLSEDSDLEELKVKLAELKNKRTELEKRIMEIKSKSTPEQNLDNLQAVRDWLDIEEEDNFNRGILDALKDLDIRKKIQGVLPTVLKRIELDSSVNCFKAVFSSGVVVEHEIIT